MDVEITEEERKCLLGHYDNFKKESRDGMYFTLNGERGFVLRDNGGHVIADVYDSKERISDIKRFTNEELEMAEWQSE